MTKKKKIIFLIGNNKFMGRKQVREQAFKLIYEYTINLEKNELSFEESLLLFPQEKEYLTTTYEGVIENYQNIIEDITKFIKSFSIERIFKVDLAILLLAIYEIKYMSAIPTNVAINEAVNLAKMYSTDKSSSYINGVLANFVK